MSALRQWEVFIRHPITRNTLKLRADGHTVAEAFSDATKLLSLAFRPKSDGKEREKAKFAIITKDGENTLMELKQFEDGETTTNNEPG